MFRPTALHMPDGSCFGCTSNLRAGPSSHIPDVTLFPGDMAFAVNGVNPCHLRDSIDLDSFLLLHFICRILYCCIALFVKHVWVNRISEYYCHPSIHIIFKCVKSGIISLSSRIQYKLVNFYINSTSYKQFVRRVASIALSA